MYVKITPQYMTYSWCSKRGITVYSKIKWWCIQQLQITYNTGQVCVMHIKETIVHRKKLSTCAREASCSELDTTLYLMLHKVNILLGVTYAILVALSPPNGSVVTGFWLVLLRQPQCPQCLVVFEALNELMNPLFPNWAITQPELLQWCVVL